MKKLILFFLLFATPIFAGECIIGSDGYVKSWTVGKYIAPQLESGDTVMEFSTIPTIHDKKLKYQSSDIVVTNEDKDVETEKEKILKKLDISEEDWEKLLDKIKTE